MHFSWDFNIEDAMAPCPMCGHGGLLDKTKCECENTWDWTYNLLLCRVIVGDLAGPDITYDMGDRRFLKCPLFSSEDSKSCDSTLYKKFILGEEPKLRVAIYDAAQVYPEYIVSYKRVAKSN